MFLSHPIKSITSGEGGNDNQQIQGKFQIIYHYYGHGIMRNRPFFEKKNIGSKTHYDQVKLDLISE